MKFRYPLQKIVDLKETEKTQAEWLLSQAIHKLRQEELSLGELQALRETLHQGMLDAAANKASIQELQELQHYLIHVDRMIELKGQAVRQAQGVVMEKQKGLHSKAVEAKKWSKAKEKAYAYFVTESRRKEQQELDEIAAVRFGS